MQIWVNNHHTIYYIHYSSIVIYMHTRIIIIIIILYLIIIWYTLYYASTKRYVPQLTDYTSHRFSRCTTGDRTGPPPVAQAVGTVKGRVRTTVPWAAGRSQGPAGGARQSGTSTARGGQTETSRGPRAHGPEWQVAVAHQRGSCRLLIMIVCNTYDRIPTQNSRVMSIIKYFYVSDS